MAPWLQIHAQTNGKAAPCCMASVHDGNEIGDLRENSNLIAIWNSENMKRLRLNMLNGAPSSICSNCYEYEKVGKFSERMQYNQDYPDRFSRVSGTMKDGTVREFNIPIIDIRFSNRCNYKCRICSSSFSSLLFEEEAKTGKHVFGTSKEINAAANESVFLESYQKLLPNVERLHFAGGEPLIMDEHYQTLEYLLSIGKTDLRLSYNTNFSTLRYKKNYIIDLWKKFKQVEVWASLDGMGEKGDYQRKGQRWKNIEENISTLQQELPQAFFGVNAAVSIFNVLHIPDFYQYMVESKFVRPDRMNLYLLFDPLYFNITNLTPSLKEKALKQFDHFNLNFLNTLSDSARIKNHIQAVINYMLSENGTLQKEFTHWIKTIDALRGENFISIFPELKEMMIES